MLRSAAGTARSLSTHIAGGSGPQLRVLISGAHGMLGSALRESLGTPKMGNAFSPRVYQLVRRRPVDDSEIFWDPYEMRIDVDRLEGFDAVVHLAGENIGSGDGPLAFTGRWTERKKHLIMESRRRGTKVLATALAAVKAKPKVLISASGVGFYGNGGERILDDTAPKGTGFLADVADVWEAETRPAAEAGIRVVNMRLGVILSQRAGVIQKLHLPFWLGLGGVVGPGTQFMSWISLGDAVRAIEHCMLRPEARGPLNVCAPNPCTNAEFTSALGHALWRPTLIPLPEFAVRCAFGEMGEETLLTSQRCVPTALTATGFRFRHPTIEEGVRAALSASGGAL